MSIKAAPISLARKIGKETGAYRVAIIAIGRNDERFAVTTWGETKFDCDAMGRWCHREAGYAAGTMVDAK